MQDTGTPASPSLKGAYESWLAQDGASSRRQSPEFELLAEHYVMESVLLSMETELRLMRGGRGLRREFWSDVVDFNGNFVHLCHRVKEEVHLIPALVETQALAPERFEVVQHEHDSAKKLTLGIRDGVEEGDWEKVLRLVVLYVHLLRAHMRKEEDEILRVAGRALQPELMTGLRAAFDHVEAEALGDHGREHFARLARRLVAATGVVYDLSNGDGTEPEQ